MMPFQRIAVKRLLLFVGLDQNSQVMGQSILPTETTKVFVVPGQMAIIETTTPAGKTVMERPMGPFGWEYTVEDSPANLDTSNIEQQHPSKPIPGMDD